MKASNCIQDGTHFILAKIDIYAGITSSQQDIITEPVNLAQHYPTSRPANTLVILKPTYAAPPTIPFLQILYTYYWQSIYNFVNQWKNSQPVLYIELRLVICIFGFSHRIHI
jgi:hypothetical protein